MNGGDEVHVSIGEVKLGTGNDVLKSSLGSCVGIALLWKSKKRYALAHCLLSESPVSSLKINARYVSQAVPSLIALMKIRSTQDFSEVEAVLVGGSNMTAPLARDEKTLIGYQNVKAAEDYLKKYGIKVIYKDVGGDTGRKIRVFCETAEFKIDLIPRIEKVRGHG
ncbi:MAG: chemotaxis protein CheD [Bdellovibrionaceae bacterium]|nr:chemotaxis protein CheD [Pseudobdellovibrionaceae bacterium]